MQSVYSMWENGVNISDGFIQEKPKRICATMGIVASDELVYGLDFSNGWLDSFKKRNHLK